MKVCSAPKGNDFLALLFRNRVSISAILVSKRVWLFHSGLELGVARSLVWLLEEATFSSFSIRPATKVARNCLKRRSAKRKRAAHPTQIFWE